MRQLVLAIACACAVALPAAHAGADIAPPPGGTTTTTTITPPPEPEPISDRDAGAVVARHRRLRRRLAAYRRETWRWQRVMGVRLTRTLRHPPATLEAKVPVWKRVAVRARFHAQHPPHLSGFLCIHRYEGSWTDAGGPYYGGLQMDLGFQRRYGAGLLARKGTADRWTPLEQIWTAERAVRAGRGFYPWPSTARVCGLI
jgi:hypothetical protein